MTDTLALLIGIAVGFAFRGLFGREKRKLGAWIMDKAWQGEQAALDLVARWREKL